MKEKRARVLLFFSAIGNQGNFFFSHLPYKILLVALRGSKVDLVADPDFSGCEIFIGPGDFHGLGTKSFVVLFKVLQAPGRHGVVHKKSHHFRTLLHVGADRRKKILVVGESVIVPGKIVDI